MAENSVVQVEYVHFSPGDEIVEWICLEKIDEGNFGQVYKVQSKNKEKFAMKIEPNRLDGGASAIKVEAEILQDLLFNKTFFVPKFIKANRREKFHWMVMELLTDSLKKLRDKSPDPTTVTPGTWSRIAIQCLYVLKTVHDCGYIHRDLKPANFAMGPYDGINSRVLYILDFGISRKFVLLKKGAPVAQTSKKDPKDYEFRVARRRTQDFKGTPNYASPNSHRYQELGRADDIWSLMYMFAEMIEQLPWSHVEDEQLMAIKLASKLKDLFKNDAFEAVDQMLRKCNYYTFPDYELVFKTFKSVYDKSGVSWLDPYDWETKQLASYQRWKLLADTRPTLFPWEYSDVVDKLRHDPWHELMQSRFLPGMELVDEMERQKKKKVGETQTAEAMTDDAKTPTPVPGDKKEKKERKEKKEKGKKEKSKDTKEKSKDTKDKSKDTKEKKDKKSEDKKEKPKVVKGAR